MAVASGWRPVRAGRRARPAGVMVKNPNTRSAPGCRATLERKNTSRAASAAPARPARLRRRQQRTGQPRRLEQERSGGDDAGGHHEREVAGCRSGQPSPSGQGSCLPPVSVLTAVIVPVSLRPSRDADLAPAAAAGAWFAEDGFAAAVDDVGPHSTQRALQACTSRLNGHTAQISHAEAACTW